jgi:hypothetical protein
VCNEGAARRCTLRDVRSVKWRGMRLPTVLGLGAMEVSGMYFARRFREPNPLPFYLNILGTEFFGFSSARRTVRTLEFFWLKRREPYYRMWNRLIRRRTFSSGAAGPEVLSIM